MTAATRRNAGIRVAYAVSASRRRSVRPLERRAATSARATPGSNAPRAVAGSIWALSTLCPEQLVPLGVGLAQKLVGADLAGPSQLRLRLDLVRQVHRVKVVQPEYRARLVRPLLLDIREGVGVVLGRVDVSYVE